MDFFHLSGWWYHPHKVQLPCVEGDWLIVVGGSWVVGRGWWVVGGEWRVVGRGWWVVGVGGGWWVVGGGWWVVGGGWWVVGRGWWVVGRGCGSWVVGRGSWVVGRGSWVPNTKLTRHIYIPFMLWVISCLWIFITPQNLWCLQNPRKFTSVVIQGVTLTLIAIIMVQKAFFFLRLKTLETDKSLRTVLSKMKTLLWLTWIGYVLISVNCK